MTTQSFPAGDAPRIVLSVCAGDLEIEVWDESTIEVATDGSIGRLVQDEEALIIQNVHDDLHLRVPASTEVVGETIHGDVTARGFQALALREVGGDVEIEDIAGEVQLANIGGDVELNSAGSFAAEQ